MLPTEKSLLSLVLIFICCIGIFGLSPYRIYLQDPNMEWNDRMLRNIGTGVAKGLFGINEYELVKQSFQLINSQQEVLAPEAKELYMVI